MIALLQTRKKTASTPSFTPVRKPMLQRKCACGGAPGPTGECAQCRRQRRLGAQKRLPPQAHAFSVPAASRVQGQTAEPPSPQQASGWEEQDPFEHLFDVEGPLSGDGKPCDTAHTKEIKNRLKEAATWRKKVNTWIDGHVDHIKKRKPTRGNFRSAGSKIASELGLLDQHFRISKVIRKKLNSAFPRSAKDEGSSRDFINWGRASFWYRRPFNRLNFDNLSFDCQAQCPEGKEGAELVGSAIPGSRKFTIYTNCFDYQSPKAKTATVLHEAFHATFDAFNHDTYSSENSYPGPSPLTNADSFATFASIIATGSSFRVQEVEVTITVPK